MHKLLLPLLICVSIGTFPSSGFAGSIVLDQENLTDVTAAFSVGLSEPGQTFVVGRSGILTSVDVRIQRNGTAGNDLTLEIRGTSNGIPLPTTTPALVTAVVPKDTVPDTQFSYISVDFGSAAIPVTQGDNLALVLRHPTGTGYLWDRGENYDNGALYWRRMRFLGADAPWEQLGVNGDFVFRTFVEIPEPSCFALLGIIIGFAGIVRRSHRI